MQGAGPLLPASMTNPLGAYIVRSHPPPKPTLSRSKPAMNAYAYSDSIPRTKRGALHAVGQVRGYGMKLEDEKERVGCVMALPSRMPYTFDHNAVTINRGNTHGKERGKHICFFFSNKRTDIGRRKRKILPISFPFSCTRPPNNVTHARLRKPLSQLIYQTQMPFFCL